MVLLKHVSPSSWIEYPTKDLYVAHGGDGVADVHWG